MAGTRQAEVRWWSKWGGIQVVLGVVLLEDLTGVFLRWFLEKRCTNFGQLEQTDLFSGEVKMSPLVGATQATAARSSPG